MENSKSKIQEAFEKAQALFEQLHNIEVEKTAEGKEVRLNCLCVIAVSEESQDGDLGRVEMSSTQLVSGTSQPLKHMLVNLLDSSPGLASITPDAVQAVIEKGGKSSNAIMLASLKSVMESRFRNEEAENEESHIDAVEDETEASSPLGVPSSIGQA